jgi:DNA-directed RNA polymerase specialized sigma24 family protein
MAFPSTHWSLLAQATLDGDGVAAAALAEFCRRYREPIVHFLRWRGVAADEAEDLAHDFIVHVIEKSTLRRADATRGRFRSFLFGALERFLGDVHDRRMALKRGGGVVVISLAAAVAEAEPATEPAGSAAFDREWAVALLGEALRRLEQDYAATDRAEEFAVLRAYLPGGVQPPPYEQASAQLGIGLGALKTEVHRMRLRFRARLREEIAATVGSPSEVEEEIDYLGCVLRVGAR